ncbi:thioredoxin-like (seleno)protein [Spirillospora sp. NPDC048911]|uniref:thioredoxin-like (seleno)protein n=1 Tax=Spirillospora sp. NPDC048911 TaxID=3364527 RepID=UPI00371B77A2
MRKLSLLLAATLALGGCGGPDGGSGDGAATVPPAPSVTPPSATAPGTPPPSGRLRSMPERLRFEGTTLDGEPFTGSNLAERPVVFWFWSPACSACGPEGRAVAAVAGRYQGRVAFVGVAGPSTGKGELRKFVARTGTGGIIQLDDRTGRLARHFKVTARSSFLLMKRDGSARGVPGPLSEGELDGHVRALADG